MSTALQPCFIDELGLNLPDLILISLKTGWRDIQSFPWCLSQERNGDNCASEYETLLISLKPVCNPQALMIRGCSDSEPAEVTVTKWGETVSRGSGWQGIRGFMWTPVKFYERSCISSDPAGVFHISPDPVGASYENFVWGGGRNDKRRREMCYSQWLAASVQAIAVWQKLYGAKLSIRIMNIVIRAMILTLHARACLSRGHRSSHIPIFTHLMGFVRTCRQDPEECLGRVWIVLEQRSPRGCPCVLWTW